LAAAKALSDKCRRFVSRTEQSGFVFVGTDLVPTSLNQLGCCVLNEHAQNI
jgi:hypothetical protein